MRISDYFYFAAGMVAGMAILAGGIMMKDEMKQMKCMRSKAANVTAMLADEAGHRISYMGRRLAKKMR